MEDKNNRGLNKDRGIGDNGGAMKRKRSLLSLRHETFFDEFLSTHNCI